MFIPSLISGQVTNAPKHLSTEVIALTPSPSQLLSLVIKVVQFLKDSISISVSGLF